jgi:hypothetical protein
MEAAAFAEASLQARLVFLTFLLLGFFQEGSARILMRLEPNQK